MSDGTAPVPGGGRASRRPPAGPAAGGRTRSPGLAGLALLASMAAPALPVAPVPAMAPPRDDADAARAVKAFRTAWRDGVTVEAAQRLADLAGRGGPRVVDAVLDVLERDATALLPTARRVLAGLQEADDLRRLSERGLRHRSPSVRAQVLLALGEGRPGDRDWRPLIEAALDDADARVRAAAVRAAGRVRADGRLDALLALADDVSARVRQEVPAALVRLVGGRCLPVLDDLAVDPSWRVRLAALRGYADLKRRVGVERLVDVLERETGRLREDALAALRRLTARPIGADPGAWRAFLAEAPDDFLDVADDVALAPARYAGGVTFHDVTSASRRFVLATDLSNSMSALAWRVDGYAGHVTRLSIATDELGRLLHGLDGSTRFGLVSFRDTASAWRSGLTPGDERGIAAAVREILGWRADGGTNLHDALRIVFDMAEAGLTDDLDGSDDPDTLFLLSDGAPTAGELTDTGLLLDYVRERARDCQLRIHCVSLAEEDGPAAFLAALAEATGGRHLVKVR